ncbi:hypothetical protein [Novosphingobium sp. B1]|uniref:hypothetical protein n=1 Tax=Novosphingobium sp. B1 TaxID=1938756 RepID=UPI00111C5A59|nr:hypothetical protein [Novosphingobium sp. B1]
MNLVWLLANRSENAQERKSDTGESAERGQAKVNWGTRGEAFSRVDNRFKTKGARLAARPFCGSI